MQSGLVAIIEGKVIWQQDLPCQIPNCFCGTCGSMMWGFMVQGTRAHMLLCIYCKGITDPYDIVVKPFTMDVQ